MRICGVSFHVGSSQQYPKVSRLTAPDAGPEQVLVVSAAIGCQFLAYKLLTLALFVFVSDGHIVTVGSILVCCLSTTLSSGFLKYSFITQRMLILWWPKSACGFRSYQSFTSINDWLIYATALSMERFSNLLLYFELVSRVVAQGCNRNEQQPFANLSDFCRHVFRAVDSRITLCLDGATVATTCLRFCPIRCRRQSSGTAPC